VDWFEAQVKLGGEVRTLQFFAMRSIAVIKILRDYQREETERMIAFRAGASPANTAGQRGAMRILLSLPPTGTLKFGQETEMSPRRTLPK
jgi:hypothetical protein